MFLTGNCISGKKWHVSGTLFGGEEASHKGSHVVVASSSAQ